MNTLTRIVVVIAAVTMVGCSGLRCDGDGDSLATALLTNDDRHGHRRHSHEREHSDHGSSLGAAAITTGAVVVVGILEALFSDR